MTTQPFGVWGLEILAICFSFLSLIGLVVLLGSFDGKEIFSWHGVTLNTVVSILATASKAALMLAVAESTSQWKWILFSREQRRLIDMERIDAASRGPLGSLKLLWRPKGIGTLRLGLVVSLLVLAVDPFAQQLIQLEQRVTHTEAKDGLANVAVPRAERYAQGTEYGNGEIIVPELVMENPDAGGAVASADFSMQSAILYGLSQSKEDVIKQLQFTCPSGNCTWPHFESLAVCSKCNNLTSSLERFHDLGTLYFSLVSNDMAINRQPYSTGFRLPNNLWIDNLNGSRYDFSDAFPKIPGVVLMTAFGTGNVSQTSSMHKIDTLVWSTSVIKVLPPDNHLAGWPDLPVEATECALYYCVKEYTTRVENGVLSETSSQVAAKRNPKSWDPSMELLEPFLSSLEFHPGLSSISRSDLQLVSTNSNTTYNISQEAVDSISSYFRATTTAPDRIDTSNTEQDNYNGSINAFLVNQTGVQFAPATAQVLWNSDNLTDNFEALAVSMTNALRQGDANGLLQGGQGGTLRTFYRVQWAWIALPVGVVLVGGVFLAFTMARSRGGAVWKSSSLALIGWGLTNGHVLEGAETVGEMEARAKEGMAALIGEKSEEEMELRESQRSSLDTPR